MTTSSYNTTSDSFATTAGEFAKAAEAAVPRTDAATAGASVAGEREQAERNGSRPLIEFATSPVNSQPTPSTPSSVSTLRDNPKSLAAQTTVDDLLESLLAVDADES